MFCIDSIVVISDKGMASRRTSSFTRAKAMTSAVYATLRTCQLLLVYFVCQLATLSFYNEYQMSCFHFSLVSEMNSCMQRCVTFRVRLQVPDPLTYMRDLGKPLENAVGHPIFLCYLIVIQLVLSFFSVLQRPYLTSPTYLVNLPRTCQEVKGICTIQIFQFFEGGL